MRSESMSPTLSACQPPRSMDSHATLSGGPYLLRLGHGVDLHKPQQQGQHPRARKLKAWLESKPRNHLVFFSNDENRFIFGTLGAHTDRQDAAGVSGRLVLTCGQGGLGHEPE